MVAMKNEIEKAFLIFSDKTSKMPVKNLDNAIKSIGYVLENSLAEMSDKTHLTLSEFVEFVNFAHENELSKDKIEESFKFFDPEDTGLIKALDLKKILSTGPDSLSESEISSLFEMFPPNSQGMICYGLPINYLFDSSKQ